jgi:hypothetical protein
VRRAIIHGYTSSFVLRALRMASAVMPGNCAPKSNLIRDRPRDRRRVFPQPLREMHTSIFQPSVTAIDDGE